MQAHRETGRARRRHDKRSAARGSGVQGAVLVPARPLALARVGLIIASVVAACAIAPARALDDHDICVVAQQLAAAAERDVGIWIDRQTRNAGMVVSCNQMTIEYRRFSYAPSAAMTTTWKARKSIDWNASQCGSGVWKDAIARGWKIILSETAADGGQAAFTARCE